MCVIFRIAGKVFYKLNQPFSRIHSKKLRDKACDGGEEALFHCVCYISSTQAGRASFQLAQSKAGWIN